MNQITACFPLLQDFSHFVKLHLELVPNTRKLEIEAEKLVAENFPQPQLEAFVRSVFEWGGYHQYSTANLDKVLEKLNSRPFLDAMNALNSPFPGIEGAIFRITRLPGLGISYGSKHLRFLRPDICPVLDSVIRCEFGYSEDSSGYYLYQRDVMETAMVLEQSKIDNPLFRIDNRWFAADVDMALFAYLQQRSGKPGWN